MHLERYLGYDEETLDFHIWYLKQKGWIARTDSAAYAITVEGVDRVSEGIAVRSDRLLTEFRNLDEKLVS